VKGLTWSIALSINSVCTQVFCNLKKCSLLQSLFSDPLPCKFETYLLFYILQFAKENPLNLDLPAIKLDEHEDVTEEAVATTLKRAISRFSTLQAHDGHWPGDYGGPMFLMPGLVLP